MTLDVAVNATAKPLVAEPTPVSQVILGLMQTGLDHAVAVSRMWDAVDAGEVTYGVDAVVRPVVTAKSR